MKLQPDKSSVPLVRAYGAQWLQIDQQRFTQSVLVSSLPGQASEVWGVHDPAQLNAQCLGELANRGAELVILGTGHRQHLAPAAWLAPFAAARVGLECMDTAAACRTYNILASEGRKVLAALILETP